MKRTQKFTIVVLLGVSLLLVGTWVRQAVGAGDRWTGGTVIATEGNISAGKEALYLLDPTTEKLTGIYWESTRNQPKYLEPVDLAKDFRNDGGDYLVACVQQTGGEDYLYVFDNVTSSFIIYETNERTGTIRAISKKTSLKKQLGR